MPTWSRGRIPGFSALVFTLVTVACGGGSPTAPGNQDFQGVWEGQWQRTSCTETGGASGAACSQTPTSGGLRLVLTQSGSTVQGNVEVAGAIINSTGSISGTGVLTLTGSGRVVVVVNGVPEGGTETLSNWSTTRSGNSMNGSFTLTIRPDNAAFGSQVLVVSLQNVTKTS